jgi:hypothetical protein
MQQKADYSRTAHHHPASGITVIFFPRRHRITIHHSIPDGIFDFWSCPILIILLLFSFQLKEEDTFTAAFFLTVLRDINHVGIWIG